MTITLGAEVKHSTAGPEAASEYRFSQLRTQQCLGPR